MNKERKKERRKKLKIGERREDKEGENRGKVNSEEDEKGEREGKEKVKREERREKTQRGRGLIARGQGGGEGRGEMR